MSSSLSWGRYPRIIPRRIHRVDWKTDPLPVDGPLLPHGEGRSYGDVGLIREGTMIMTGSLNRAIHFDTENGLFACESGMNLKEILDIIVPRGWFLPVCPGTQYVSVGGAIANDIHGKNHHVAGTFGCHVTRFELLRSDGSRRICSSTENTDLFRATIGGLGLTGLVTWAEFHLQKIANPCVDVETFRYKTLQDFFSLSRAADGTHAYTVAWIDATARGKSLARGIFMKGNHADAGAQCQAPGARTVGVPELFPGWILNPFTITVGNMAKYYSQITPHSRKTTHYQPFFFPLDALRDWNRVYGRRGFLQYQFVLPFSTAEEGVREILGVLSRARVTSFVSVLKCFGDRPSPGMLSFPMLGATLALDVRMEGEKTLRTLAACDSRVLAYGGRLYPAKDACMSAQTFQACYPAWKTFASFVDPQFTSAFWQRVTTL